MKKKKKNTPSCLRVCVSPVSHRGLVSHTLTAPTVETPPLFFFLLLSLGSVCRPGLPSPLPRPLAPFNFFDLLGNLSPPLLVQALPKLAALGVTTIAGAERGHGYS
eukprot:GHVT01062089.1.p2 GENE.GHVT01062089.1~~GHVT01062089.1.p2  ORF type:complete len:106 (+),score=12.34 GHVT01062089.1:2231-2548(+)